ncbi:hypothetical protein BWQ96_07437 [Gracilariopsis chorda]|uniref:DDE Tnp4 domain-containing protein n=1 Tax=Gracilariopsis chorda TaxID=448386 RepID=A0A2V3ILA4_9FLOR|nr:hypothetical protein BWQ96_07437 [Gracilariopsis chorda]|eukprot:PXF42843.1 hypothetical protein BWQ96_07437 [Gracilariopsis chorda]
MDIEKEEEYVSCATSVAGYALLLYQGCVSTVQAFAVVLSELDDNNYDGDFSVNPPIPKISRLNNLIQGHLSLFKTNAGLYPAEFEALYAVVCPIIIQWARHTNNVRGLAGIPSKLMPSERLLSCIMYLRGRNGVREEASYWNYSRTSLRDDAMFVCGIINESMASEISWPTTAERQQQRSRISLFPGCVGYVDGILCRIRRPHDRHHRAYFNGRKKMYCFNSAVVIDHDGMFIYIAPGNAGSYHDVTVLRDTGLSRNWQEHFAVDHDSPHPVEYLLGDPGYLGLDHFILRCIDARELANVDQDPVLRAFNKLHAGYRVTVEWGIGGLKQLFRRF